MPENDNNRIVPLNGHLLCKQDIRKYKKQVLISENLFSHMKKITFS